MSRAASLALLALAPLALLGCSTGAEPDCGDDWARISGDFPTPCPKPALQLWTQSAGGRPVCPSAQGDSACVACSKTSCCGPVVACLQDTSCSSHVEGTSDGANTLYDAAIACVAQHCKAECPVRTP